MRREHARGNPHRPVTIAPSLALGVALVIGSSLTTDVAAQATRPAPKPAATAKAPAEAPSRSAATATAKPTAQYLEDGGVEEIASAAVVRIQDQSTSGTPYGVPFAFWKGPQ